MGGLNLLASARRGDAVFHHLLARDDGLLAARDLDHCLHRLLLRVLSRRSNVSRRYHAGCRAGGNEVAAILLRTVLSNRDLPRPAARRRNDSSACHPDWMGPCHMGGGTSDVAARFGPLP